MRSLAIDDLQVSEFFQKLFGKSHVMSGGGKAAAALFKLSLPFPCRSVKQSAIAPGLQMGEILRMGIGIGDVAVAKNRRNFAGSQKSAHF